MTSANWRKQRVQIRRGTAAEWALRNPVLLPGEIGYESNTNQLKVGDGVAAWAALPYVTATTTIGSVLPTAAAAGDVLRYNGSQWAPYPETGLVDGGNFA